MKFSTILYIIGLVGIAIWFWTADMVSAARPILLDASTECPVYRQHTFRGVTYCRPISRLNRGTNVIKPLYEQQGVSQKTSTFRRNYTKPVLRAPKRVQHTRSVDFSAIRRTALRRPSARAIHQRGVEQSRRTSEVLCRLMAPKGYNPCAKLR